MVERLPPTQKVAGSNPVSRLACPHMSPPSPPRASATLPYVPALDGIRALAITLVVIHHTAFVVPGLHDWVAGGFLGVDVFFVLSGFLVTALLVVRGRGPGHLRAFYARRVGRLGPALVVLMLAITAITLIGRTPAPGLGATWLGTMTATTNWLMLDGTTISLYAGHLWSLAVEGQFYVV